MNAIHTALQMAEGALTGIILGPLVFAVVFVLAVLPTIAPGALLVGVLDWRLARPDPMDTVAVRRRIRVLLTTFVVAAMAGLRVTFALHDATLEPAWGTALVVAGLLQLGTGVVTLRRDAPWRPNGLLVANLGMPFLVGLALVYARPLLTLIG